MIKIISINKAIGFVILVALAVLTGCGEDPAGPDINTEQPGNDFQPLSELPGDPNEPAIEALFDFSVTVDVEDGDISVENETEIIRTKLEFAFVPGTTVGDINDLLTAYEARIIDMLPDRPFLIVHIPDPGNLRALRDIIEEFKNEENIGAVWEGVVPSFDMLPDHIDATTPCAESECVNDAQMNRIKHHLSVRGHAAWNLREAIQDRPWLVIADGFGDGIFEDFYASEFKNPNDFVNGNPFHHGYHVLGIINADYDHQSEVTGTFPGTMLVRAFDLKGRQAWSQLENQLVRLIKGVLDTDVNANIIVNTSIGTNGDFSDGIRWWGKVVDLQDNFIHFTAAGNTGENRPDSTPAYETSSFSYAALGDIGLNDPLLELLFDHLDIQVASNLENTFVVENRTTNPDAVVEEDARDAKRPWPGCAHNRSIMGGNLSAIGTDVYSFTDGFGTRFLTGTSMATPQAAGTAAFMWALNPSLRVNDIMFLINKTARSTEVTSTHENCRSETPAPVIDTYDAVLAAGGVDARLALLDVTGSGTFTGDDIAIFLEEFDERDGILDYSRYDLNGSGQTGGSATDRFDLNHDLEYGIVTQIIENLEVEFIESSVTDTDILCYYAYSDLYSGDIDRRSELLGNVCIQEDPILEVNSSRFSYSTECAIIGYVTAAWDSAETSMITIGNFTTEPVWINILVTNEVPIQGDWEDSISDWEVHIVRPEVDVGFEAGGPESGELLELQREEVNLDGQRLGIWSGRFTAQLRYDDVNLDEEEIITVQGEFSGLWNPQEASNIYPLYPPFPEACEEYL
ncbi:MAG: S8/S53 family peptidase [Balneolaceae bacterium]|nr:S8/S53 family peptidase [Balneolaceae bacterium]